MQACAVTVCAPHSTTAGQHAATSMNEAAVCVVAEEPAQHARVDSCAAVEHSHSQQRDNCCCQQEGNGQTPHGVALWRRTAQYCTSEASFLGVRGVFVGCLGTTKKLKVLQ